MSASPKAETAVSLEEFLRMPDIDSEPPYLEYIDGRIEAKAMPSRTHNAIETRLEARLNEFAEPRGLGLSFHEVRFTFAGRSILPDVSFQLSANIEIEPDGRFANLIPFPPDIHVEIISPDQSVGESHSKLLFSVANGCAMGILIHPDRSTIDVYRPGRTPERLTDDGAIDFAPVLPGLVVPVSEVFSWMVVRLRRPGAAPE
jgi:Uma2 family endonuclease